MNSLTTMVDRIFAIIVSLAIPWHGPKWNPENPRRFYGRLQTIAQALHLETQTDLWQNRPQEDLIALVATIWNAESHYALSVHSGRRRGPGGRAVCLGQIIANGVVPRRQWRQLTGTDLASTRRCAEATVQIIAYHTQRCVNHPGRLKRIDAARIFTAYANGVWCGPSDQGRHRATKWQEVRYQLERGSEDPDEPPLEQRPG